MLDFKEAIERGFLTRQEAKTYGREDLAKMDLRHGRDVEGVWVRILKRITARMSRSGR